MPTSIGQLSLWPVSLAVIFSQTLHSIIRAAVSVKLAQSVVRTEMCPNAARKNYLKELDDTVKRKLKEKRLWKPHHWRIGLDLGESLLWWMGWTAVISFIAWLGFVFLLRVM
jgi:hypothetical protein